MFFNIKFCHGWLNDVDSTFFFSGTVDWNTVESCPTYFGVEDAQLKELAEALKILHVYCDTKDWNEDDFISVFEELTGAYWSISLIWERKSRFIV